MQSNNINKYIQNKLRVISKKNQLRKLIDVKRMPKNKVTYDNKRVISFSCNDYLSLSLNKKVIEASKNALQSFGVGAGASRLVTGNSFLNSILEDKIKDLKKTEACCIFGSGFLANLGTISSLVNNKDLILIDELSHASTFLGAKLSGAEIIKFIHNNTNDLEAKLIKYRNKYNKCLILTEGIFSMDGDLSPQDKISDIKNNYNSILMVDDAHGFGVLGDGSGSNSIFKKRPDIDIYIGTLSKAVGSYGGFVCGSKDLIEFIINKCRTQIYTTGLPPSVIAACIKSIDIITKNKELIKKPLTYAKYFCKKLELKEPESPIVPVVIGNEKKTLNLSQTLLKNDLLVSAIRPPTVPINTSRLRIAFNSSHTKGQINKLVKLLKKNIDFK